MAAYYLHELTMDQNPRPQSRSSLIFAQTSPHSTDSAAHEPATSPYIWEMSLPNQTMGFDLSQPPPMITQTQIKEKQAMASGLAMYNDIHQNTAHRSPFLGSNGSITDNFMLNIDSSPSLNTSAAASNDIRPRPGSAVLCDTDLSGGSHPPVPQHSPEHIPFSCPQGNDWNHLGSYASPNVAQSTSTMPPTGYTEYHFPAIQTFITSSGPQSHNPTDAIHTASSCGSAFAGTSDGDFDPNFLSFVYQNTGDQLTVPGQANGQGYLNIGSSASSIVSGLVTPAPSEYEATLSRTHTPLDLPPLNAFPVANGGGYNNSANHFPVDFTTSHTNASCDESPNTGFPTPESHQSHSSPMVPPSITLEPDYRYIPYEGPSYGGAPFSMGGAQETLLTQDGLRRSTKTQDLNGAGKSKAPRRRGSKRNVDGTGEGPSSAQGAGSYEATFHATLQSVAGEWGPVSVAGDHQWTVQAPPEFTDTGVLAPAQAHEGAESMAAQRKSSAARARKSKRNTTGYQAARRLPRDCPWQKYCADADDYVFTCRFGECANKVAVTFRTQSQAEKHLDDVHNLSPRVAPTSEVPVKCEWPDCPGTSNGEFAASSIRRHVLHQHSANKPMQCTFPPGCGFRYKRSEDLKNHFVEKHMADYKQMIAER
ncbi:hypothetical protein HYPSUDRAFT_783034 [Hypholoma sublateritium FD-334 SS-4]|uniref:C2H2-type domain-containing protein n=1 Tax=Hypholoma sublateritium (strain FD-334 SS-4) TaxID=945553 RepID=A0A0D2PL43_HYPSF|nr:hypothetical protein HYPSUDRAFT_783034 [Hypholoma sublateritium FD-334 SS-4]